MNERAQNRLKLFSNNPEKLSLAEIKDHLLFSQIQYEIIMNGGKNDGDGNLLKQKSKSSLLSKQYMHIKSKYKESFCDSQNSPSPKSKSFEKGSHLRYNSLRKAELRNCMNDLDEACAQRELSNQKQKREPENNTDINQDYSLNIVLEQDNCLDGARSRSKEKFGTHRHQQAKIDDHNYSESPKVKYGKNKSCEFRIKTSNASCARRKIKDLIKRTSPTKRNKRKTKEYFYQKKQNSKNNSRIEKKLNFYIERYYEKKLTGI